MIARLGQHIIGPLGAATEVLLELEDDDRPELAATLATWHLHCPGQSPAWDRYSLAIYHLRPLEGVEQPAHLRFPGATHELALFALDPKRSPRVDDPSTWAPLMPINACEQVELPDDAAAVTLAELAAKAVVNGVLPAEPAMSGAVEPWRTSMIRTSAHLRGGGARPVSELALSRTGVRWSMVARFRDATIRTRRELAHFGPDRRRIANRQLRPRTT